MSTLFGRLRRQRPSADIAYQNGLSITIDIRWLELPTEAAMEENPGARMDEANSYGVMLEFLVRAERKGVPIDHGQRSKIGRTKDGRQMIVILAPDPYPDAYRNKIREAYAEATGRQLVFGRDRSDDVADAAESVGEVAGEGIINAFFKFLRGLAD